MWVAGQATLGEFIVHSNIVAGNTEKHRVIPSFSKITGSECKKKTVFEEGDRPNAPKPVIFKKS
jgi:hypothetical protein